MKAGYKQTEVGLIPENWDAKKLGDFVSLQRGHDLTERDRRAGTCRSWVLPERMDSMTPLS
jgi:hypothetical protein